MATTLQVEESLSTDKPPPSGQAHAATTEPTVKQDLSTDTPAQTSQKRTAPRFPSPSECSKWLMLFWFAGFPNAKIRWLLSQYFKLDPHKAYNVENIEATFRRLQNLANRNNPDYNTEPYMYYIMTSKSSSPFEFRQSATRWLEKHHPGKQATGDDEVREMNAWHRRWCEEVARLQKSKVSQYLERADEFEKKLEYYAQHFDAKGYLNYLEDEDLRPSPRRSKKSAITKSRSNPQIAANNRTWGDGVPVYNIERPKLTVSTVVGDMFSRSKHEGTPTPSSAQHLDELGFFARRPKKTSPASIVEARTRTPSLSSSTENSDSSKTSLQVFSGSERPLSAS